MPVTLTPEATHVPGYCAASGSTSGPFVDCGSVIPDADARIYLSVAYLHSIAADIGLVPAPELVKALADLDAAYTLTEKLSERVERFEEDIFNVSDALVSFLAEMRSRTTLVDELKAARDAIDALARKVVELEAGADAS